MRRVRRTFKKKNGQLSFPIMKNHSGALLGEKLPFYQKVLNMTFGGISQSSASTRKAEEPLAPSPFRRGYTRAAAAAAVGGRPGIPVTPIHVVTTTPGHPAHMGTGGATTTPVTPSTTPSKHGSSTAASIFRSFRRRSLRRSFRRTKSFLVKTPTPTPAPTITSTGIANIKKDQIISWPVALETRQILFCLGKEASAFS